MRRDIKFRCGGSYVGTRSVITGNSSYVTLTSCGKLMLRTVITGN